jgi:hypothetical protein
MVDPGASSPSWALAMSRANSSFVSGVSVPVVWLSAFVENLRCDSSDRTEPLTQEGKPLGLRNIVRNGVNMLCVCSKIGGRQRSEVAGASAYRSARPPVCTGRNGSCDRAAQPRRISSWLLVFLSVHLFPTFLFPPPSVCSSVLAKCWCYAPVA